MRNIIKLIALGFIVISIGSCYWQPESSETGSITIDLDSKDISSNFTGTAFHIDFWNEDDIEGMVSLPYLYINEIGEPLVINGETEYTVESTANSWPSDVVMDDPVPTGEVVIPEIPIGIVYRMRFSVYYYNAGSKNSSPNYWGLSEPFEVVPGGNTNVPIELYNWTSGSAT